MSSEALEYASSCFLPTSWMALPLVNRKEYNYDTTVYTFGLPEGKSLELPVCACLLLKAPGKGRKEGGGKDDFDGSDAVRPYTPTSSNEMLGAFELMVKRYDGGAVSQYLFGLKPGEDSVEFKHIKFNVKSQYPFDGKKSFTMLAAGSGITPMYQALHKIMSTPGDDRKVTLIYGNKSAEDVLLKDEIDAWAKQQPDRLKVIHVVGTTPDAPLSDDAQEKLSPLAATLKPGWVDEAKIKEFAFAPSDDTMIFVCGLPPMYNILCGPRTEKEVAEGTVLQKLGYTKDMVSKM